MRELLAERIRTLRTARGLSQEELAARSGLTPQALSNLETKRSLPSIDSLVALAGALNVSVSALLEPEPNDEAERLYQRVHQSLMSLSLEDLRLIGDLVDTWVAHRTRRTPR